MTNIIGMALIVLSTNSTTIYETSAVRQTCEDVGCTNQVEIETQVLEADGRTCLFHQAMPGEKLSDYDIEIKCDCKPTKWKTEKTTGCVLLHYKEVVVPVVTQREIVLGVQDIPLFMIFEQKHVPSYKEQRKSFAYISTTYYEDGIWITPIDSSQSSTEGNE